MELETVSYLSTSRLLALLLASALSPCLAKDDKVARWSIESIAKKEPPVEVIRYFLQIGAYENPSNATGTINKLKHAGFTRIRKEKIEHSDKPLTKVITGPYTNRQKAHEAKGQLKELGMEPFLRREYESIGVSVGTEQPEKSDISQESSTEGYAIAESEADLSFTSPDVATSMEDKRASLGDSVAGSIHSAELSDVSELQLTLEQCLEIALQKNLSISIARLARDEVEPDVEGAKGFFDPTIGTSFIASDSKTLSSQEDEESQEEESKSKVTRTLSAFISKELPTGGNVTVLNDLERENKSDKPKEYGSDLTLSVTQPLMRGGRVYVATKPIKDAEFNLKIEEASLRAQILRVMADTKAAYYVLALAGNIIKAIEKAIERDITLVEASQALLEAGLGRKRDVVSAELSLAKDETRLAAAREDYDNARDVLLDILGISLATRIDLLDQEITYKPVPVELDQWIAHALENRPEILRVNDRLAQSDLNIRSFQNASLPQLDLVTSYGRSQSGLTLGRALDYGGKSWSAGLLFSVPIGNRTAKSNLSRARRERQRLLAERSQVQRTVELEVRTAVTQLQGSAARITPRRAELELANTKVEIAKGRFSMGLATNEDITDAQEDILDAEEDLLSAIVDYNVAIAKLEAAVAEPVSISH